MPESHKVSTLSEILDELQRLKGEKRTGTLFITTHDHHAARFVLDEGRVMAVGYSQLRGYDALPRIQQISGGSYRFVDGGFISMDEVPMPDTDELLDMLQDGTRVNPADRQAAIPIAQGAAFEAINRELTTYLGPVARMICEDYVEDYGAPTTVADVQRMIEEVSGEIDAPEQRREFKVRARKALEGL